MSSARKTKKITDNVQLQLLYSDDAQFRHWESHLFNDVYLRKDLQDQHAELWNNEEDIGFQNFLNTLRDLVSEYKNKDAELTSWSETETINNWVKHILNSLGWSDNCSGVQNPFLEETSFRYEGKTYRTDILVVDHPKEKQLVSQAKGDDKLVEARRSVLIPVEVKYWQRLEEYRQGRKEQKNRLDCGSDDFSKTMSPNEQVIQYMKVLKKDWGILTDGSRWRLFNNELSSEEPNRFYDFNLYSLFQSIATEKTEADRREIVDAAKYFYHFFSKESFYPKDDSQESFVNEVLRYSKKYVNKVEEDLKERFVKAMNIACNGLYKSAKQNGLSQELETIRNSAESSLFNILFIKSLESRGILPVSATDYKKISLSNTIDKIERFDPDRDDLLNVRDLERAFKKGNGNSFNYHPKGFELHDRILRLTMVIHGGSSKKDNFGFEIAGFKESVFSTEEWQIFKTCKLHNQDWVKILFQLGYADSESLNRKYQQIPYSYFTPRQLGSIYESFLEFKIEVASEDLVYERKQWKKADFESKKYRSTKLPRAKKGDLFFTPNNEDRKATGSYYTPEYIVRYMLQKTLTPFFKNRTAKEILTLKVCDPAMGSGHFLVGALDFLTKSYIDKLYDEASGDLDLSIYDVKREILHSCIYGADINPSAAKLAKMSLWLESASMNKKLERLDDQLKIGNSLLESSLDWKEEYSEVFEEKNGFDVIIGNPPYVFTRGSNFTDEEKAEYKKFKVGQGKLNSFAMFFELGFELLNEQGYLGFICPTNVFRTTSYTPLREYLLKETNVAMVGLPGAGVFEGVTAETGILVLSKQKSKEKTRVYEMTSDGHEVLTNEVDQNAFLDNVEFVMTLNLNPQYMKIFSSMNKAGNHLEHITDYILEGIVTTKGKDQFIAKSKKGAKWQKFLEGKDIKPFRVESRGLYINYDRKVLHRAREESVFLSKEKVLIQRISGGMFPLKAAYDAEQYYTYASINNIILKEEFKDWHMYLTCLLNSKLLNSYYGLNFTNFSNLTVNIAGTFLEKLPIVLSEEYKSKVDKLGKKLVGLKGKSNYLSVKEELENVIFDIYKLNKSEKKAILDLYKNVDELNVEEHEEQEEVA